MAKQYFNLDDLVFVEKPVIGEKGCTRFNDLSGQHFGRLTVLGYAGKKGTQTYWFCICDCNKIIRAISSGLKKWRYPKLWMFSQGKSKRNSNYTWQKTYR